jgi:hypothetical protein
VNEDNMFEVFLLDNTSQTKKNEFTCRYCESKNEKFTNKSLKQHFIDNHRKEFEEYFGDDVSWEDAVKASKKKKKKRTKNEFWWNVWGRDARIF